jgi:phosphoglucosamine mutase
MARELFGTDGIRGVPGRFPLDDATVHAVGQALGDLVVQNNEPGGRRVLIGIDTRESGPLLAANIARGLSAAGVEPVSAGVITTPGVAALVRTNDYGAGVVISASHNPFTDNGIKLFSHSGMKFPDRVEERLENEILRHRHAALAATLSATADPDPFVAEPGLAEDYLALLRERANGEARLDDLVIVLDCANGAASGLAPALFASLGARVILFHASPDGRNINAGCGSLHPESMCRAVVENGAHLGVAFDGDADRAIFSTAKGHLVDGDGVLWVAARARKAAGRLKGGAVVGTTMTNLGLERALAGEGISLARVPVGDRYVLEEMLRRGANLGGEPSGHVIFLDDSPAGDGIQTALKIAAAIVRDDSLDSLLAGLTLFPQRIVNVRVAKKTPLDSLPEVVRLTEEARRALGEANRIVLRYSGTEPLARVMVEAESGDDVVRWSAAIAQAIRDAIGASEE